MTFLSAPLHVWADNTVDKNRPEVILVEWRKHWKTYKRARDFFEFMSLIRLFFWGCVVYFWWGFCVFGLSVWWFFLVFFFCFFKWLGQSLPVFLVKSCDPIS